MDREKDVEINCYCCDNGIFDDYFLYSGSNDIGYKIPRRTQKFFWAFCMDRINVWMVLILIISSNNWKLP